MSMRYQPALPQETFPSVKTILEQRLGCRYPGGKGWSFYWMEGGCELTYFSGDEGPYECTDVADALACIGGDRPAELTLASRRYLDSLPKGHLKMILRVLRKGAGQ